LRDGLLALASRMDAEHAVVDRGQTDLILAVALLATLVGRSLAAAWRTVLALLGLGLAAAMLPSLVAYPVAHTVLDFLLLAGVVIYASFGLAIATAIDCLVLSRDGTESADPGWRPSTSST
ncbi:MAG: hypothetical protein AB7K36_15745, partial [Chloroflexota bacterium]